MMIISYQIFLNNYKKEESDMAKTNEDLRQERNAIKGISSSTTKAEEIRNMKLSVHLRGNSITMNICSTTLSYRSHLRKRW